MKITGRKIKEIRKLKGKTGKEIALITGVGINTVNKYRKDKRVEKNWTEREVQKLTNWRSEGISYAEIAMRLHRTENCVKIKMCRYRKTIKTDPQKRLALHWIGKAFRMEPNPTLALRAIRKARIFEMGEDLK